MSNLTKVTIKLIQNYYERKGSFDYINNSELVSFIPENDKSLEENCYEILGYTATDDFSAVECHAIRMSVLTEDLSYARDYMLKHNLRTLDELKDILKKHDLLPEQYQGLTIKVPAGIAKYVDLLSTYFKGSKTLPVTFKGKSLPASVVSSSLKLEPTKIAQNVKALMQDNPELIQFELLQETKPCSISRGIFYVDKELSDSQKQKIIQLAWKVSSGLNANLPKDFAKNAKNIPILYLTDPEMYLNLLETAEGNNQTYAELMSSINFHIEDLLPAYKRTGVLPFVFGNEVLLITEAKDSNKQVCTIPKSIFNIFVKEL